MFASHANQENTVYEQQTAAAAKRQAITKTPANKAPKTPFKSHLNNENAPTGQAGKLAGKTGIAERNAFVTPAGPRIRAPLGNKTTNAKAIQTPAVPATEDKLSSAKQSSPRLRRSKIKIHEAAPVETEDVLLDPQDREIEYMAPREVPLPDYPDDIWPYDRRYPQLEGKNFTRGWWAEYAPRGGSDGENSETSDFEEQCRRTEAKIKKPETVRKQAKAIPTGEDVNAKTAAAALAKKPLQPFHFAAPTAATKARRAPSNSSVTAGATHGPGNPRFAAAKAASKSTIGYSKGRAVSALARTSVWNASTPPGATLKPKQQTDNKFTLADLLQLSLLDDESRQDTTFVGANNEASLEDDSLEDFQLDL